MRTWRREIGHRLRQEQPVSRYIESSTSPRHLPAALVTGHAVSEHAQHANTPTAPKPWKEGYVVHNQKEKKTESPLESTPEACIKVPDMRRMASRRRTRRPRRTCGLGIISGKWSRRRITLF